MKLSRIKLCWLSQKIQSNSIGVNTTSVITFGLTKRFYNEESASADAENAPLEPLYDLHGRRHNYLRISLTERCNLRCQYCMPAEGVALSRRAALLARGELLRAVRALAAAGVDKLRLTGGEPTLRADLVPLVQELASIPGITRVGMTSNGVALTRRLPALQRAGLSHLNLSLDSLQPRRYEEMARRPGLPRVLAALDLALQLGYSPVKLNVVLVKGFNDDEIGDFVDLTRDRDIEVRFIEFMPFTGNRWDDSKLVPARAALRAAAARAELAPLPPRAHDTARLWRARDHRGSVGFIASMTQPFCASCNRLRLTADGNLKVCLFGAAEVSLRDAMRAGASDERLVELTRAALRNKRPQHAGEWRATAIETEGAPRATTSHPPLRCRHAGAGAHRQPPHDPHRRLAARTYCCRGRAGGDEPWPEEDEEEEDGPLTHLDGAGRARMVDVSGKAVSRRAAVAECRLEVSARVLRLLRDPRAPKGDALCVARVAGTLAAKRAADLIPLCHPLPLASARVDIRLEEGAGAVRVRCSVRVEARTGAEMEALAGCAVAALTLYDMCKAADRGMRITDLRLVSKEGGRSGALLETPPK